VQRFDASLAAADQARGHEHDWLRRSHLTGAGDAHQSPALQAGLRPLAASQEEEEQQQQAEESRLILVLGQLIGLHNIWRLADALKRHCGRRERETSAARRPAELVLTLEPNKRKAAQVLLDFSRQADRELALSMLKYLARVVQKSAETVRALGRPASLVSLDFEPIESARPASEETNSTLQAKLSNGQERDFGRNKKVAAFRSASCFDSDTNVLCKLSSSKLEQTNATTDDHHGNWQPASGCRLKELDDRPPSSTIQMALSQQSGGGNIVNCGGDDRARRETLHKGCARAGETRLPSGGRKVQVGGGDEVLVEGGGQYASSGREERSGKISTGRQANEADHNEDPISRALQCILGAPSGKPALGKPVLRSNQPRLCHSQQATKTSDESTIAKLPHSGGRAASERHPSRRQAKRRPDHRVCCPCPPDCCHRFDQFGAPTSEPLTGPRAPEAQTGAKPELGRSQQVEAEQRMTRSPWLEDKTMGQNTASKPPTGAATSTASSKLANERDMNYCLRLNEAKDRLALDGTICTDQVSERAQRELLPPAKCTTDDDPRKGDDNQAGRTNEPPGYLMSSLEARASSAKSCTESRQLATLGQVAGEPISAPTLPQRRHSRHRCRKTRTCQSRARVEDLHSNREEGSCSFGRSSSSACCCSLSNCCHYCKPSSLVRHPSRRSSCNQRSQSGARESSGPRGANEGCADVRAMSRSRTCSLSRGGNHQRYESRLSSMDLNDQL